MGFASSNFRFVQCLFSVEENHGLDLTNVSEYLSHKGRFDNCG